MPPREPPVAPSVGDADLDGASRATLVCVRCGAVVTYADQRSEIDGLHQHTFFNPAGVVYTIGCFEGAAGATPHGTAETAFSWFAGWAWRIASCAACGAHVGWRWERGEASFFGLVLASIRPA